MATHTLDFERPLLELERQIDEMKRTAGDTAVDVSKELAALERKLAELRGEIYRNLTPMQRVQVARHPKRPYTLDYVNTVFTDFAVQLDEVGEDRVDVVEGVGALGVACHLDALHRGQVAIDLAAQLRQLSLEGGELLGHVHGRIASDALHFVDLALELQQRPLEVQRVGRHRSGRPHEMHVVGAEQPPQRRQQVVGDLDA